MSTFSLLRKRPRDDGSGPTGGSNSPEDVRTPPAPPPWLTLPRAEVVPASAAAEHGVPPPPPAHYATVESCGLDTTVSRRDRLNVLKNAAQLLRGARRILVMDTETSGFSAERDELLEVAALELDAASCPYKPTGLRFHSRIRPSTACVIHPMAARCNGLTVEALQHEPPRDIVRHAFLRFLSAANANGPGGTGPVACGASGVAEDVLWVTHNTAFDLRMLNAFLRPMDGVPDADEGPPARRPPQLCTLRLFKAMFPGQPADLDSASAFFGLPQRPDGEAHNAAQDAVMAARLFEHIAARLADMLPDDDVDEGPSTTT